MARVPVHCAGTEMQIPLLGIQRNAQYYLPTDVVHLYLIAAMHTGAVLATRTEPPGRYMLRRSQHPSQFWPCRFCAFYFLHVTLNNSAASDGVLVK